MNLPWNVVCGSICLLSESQPTPAAEIALIRANTSSATCCSSSARYYQTADRLSIRNRHSAVTAIVHRPDRDADCQSLLGGQAGGTHARGNDSHSNQTMLRSAHRSSSAHSGVRSVGPQEQGDISALIVRLHLFFLRLPFQPGLKPGASSSGTISLCRLTLDALIGVSMHVPCALNASLGRARLGE